jgi:hypothetical protein
MLSRFSMVAVLLATGCKSSGSKPKQFFEQSRRREATADERDLIVNISGCSAFFVKNSVNKLYLMTAQHCLSGTDPELWCQQHAGYAGTPASGESNVGCKRVVASEPKRDILLFELNDNPEYAGRGLSLGRFQPRASTRMKMLGYPSDGQHSFNLTATENCWISAVPVPTPHANDKHFWVDTSGRHNCTTYGGNSGGPMIMESTDIAIGLPFTYKPGDFNQTPAFDASNAAWIALMSEFVEKFYDKLATAGVVIAATQPENGDPGDFLPTGRYYEVPQGSCTLYVVPSYMSNTALKHIKVYECFNTSFESDDKWRKYECESETKCALGNKSIEQISKRSFVYNNEGTKATYYFMGQKVDVGGGTGTEGGNTGTESGNGGTLTYFNWEAGQPDDQNHRENCVLAKPGGRWADFDCQKKKFFACQSTSNPEEWDIDAKRGTWDEHPNRCKNGFKFAAPKTAEDVSNLVNIMGDDSIWINLTDEQQEGTFLGK